TLTWNFGAFANALNGPADNTLRLVYTARIVDESGIAAPGASPASTTTARTNSATLAYHNQDDDPVSAGPATASLDVEQPRLTIAKTRVSPAADNIVLPGETATFRLTVANNGTGPAYNVALADTLPAGLRTATPALGSATLNGSPVTLATPAYAAATGVWSLALDDAQILLPGETLVVDYTVTVDEDAPKGSVLANSAAVTGYASKPSADTTEHRVYPATAPSSQKLIAGLNVAGFVYNQLIPNGVKDATEDWSEGTPVIVNLVTNSAIAYGDFSLGANQVIRSVSVPVTAGALSGAFTFSHVPAGDYRIVIAGNAAATSAVAPATWTFDTPANGTLASVVLTTADLSGQNLGLYQGRIVSGRVYNDAAPFGSRESETWAAGTTVVVNLVDIYATPTVAASITVPAGAGTYTFTGVRPGSYRLVVSRAGQTSAVAASAPANWVFVEPENGTRDNLTVAMTDLTEQDFGLTPGRTISGFVYNDTNPNGLKDGYEDWLGGMPVVVNLVKASNGVVVASANVPVGSGAYAFTNIGPGNYRLVVTDFSGSTTAVAPPTWLFRAPANGTLTVTVAGADLTEQDFSLYRGRSVAGTVFRDTGDGAGTANNGRRDGAEPG
ncbi:MAG TPA: SdrD B-like domain-containing protein, partial [Longimicrobiales bacterium]|nr:SdrD B-like domain-containing protein [Longimicrobiales bacterium]